MAARGREQHQPEPWKSDGRSIVNASGWVLAKTIFESDARRIVAAVNDVLGIPTAALEAGFIREILVPRPEAHHVSGGARSVGNRPGGTLRKPGASRSAASAPDGRTWPATASAPSRC